MMKSRIRANIVLEEFSHAQALSGLVRKITFTVYTFLKLLSIAMIYRTYATILANALNMTALSYFITITLTEIK